MSDRALDTFKDAKEGANRLREWLHAKDGDEISLAWTARLREMPEILRTLDRRDRLPLFFAIGENSSYEKVQALLNADVTIAQVMHRGQLPLHVIIDKRDPSAPIIQALIDAYPKALKVPDENGLLPPALLLRLNPFPSSCTHLCRNIVSLCPESAATYVDGQLPLHLSIRNRHPDGQVEMLLRANRAAAGVPSRGAYPMHLAVEAGMNIIIVDQLIDAHPAALLEKMPAGAGKMALVLEQACEKEAAIQMKRLLLHGGQEMSSMNPRARAYGIAAAKGFHTVHNVNLPEWLSGDRSVVTAGTKVINQPIAGARLGDMPFVVVVPGNQFVVRMDLSETVATLKQHIEKVQGTPWHEQRLTLNDHQMVESKQLCDYNMNRSSEVHMVHRCDILEAALTHRMDADDDSLILDLLALRPKSAHEENHMGQLPLVTALQRFAGANVVKALLTRHPQAATHQNSSSVFPLHLALEKGYGLDVIKLLLDGVKAADWTAEGGYFPARRLGKENTNEDTAKLPMHLALENACDLGTLKLLLESKCPIFSRSNGLLPLEALFASKAGFKSSHCHMIMIRMSLEVAGLKQKFDDPVVEESFQALLRHLREGRETVQTPMARRKDGLQSALRRGIEDALMQPNLSGRLPLHTAIVTHTDQEIIEDLCLLSPGATRVPDGDGCLPLHLAITNKAPFTVVRCLLRHDQETVFLRDTKGNAPVSLAVVNGARPGVIHELVKADKNALLVLDRRGRSPVQIALDTNPPSWIIEELAELMPEEAKATINLFSFKGNPRSGAILLQANRIAEDSVKQVEANILEDTVGKPMSLREDLEYQSKSAPDPARQLPSPPSASLRVAKQLMQRKGRPTPLQTGALLPIGLEPVREDSSGGLLMEEEEEEPEVLIGECSLRAPWPIMQGEVNSAQAAPRPAPQLRPVARPAESMFFSNCADQAPSYGHLAADGAPVRGTLGAPVSSQPSDVGAGCSLLGMQDKLQMPEAAAASRASVDVSLRAPVMCSMFDGTGLWMSPRSWLPGSPGRRPVLRVPQRI